MTLVSTTAGGGQKVLPQQITEPYHIGVWYFTLWNSLARGFQVEQSLKVYGRPDVWAGVRDYAEGHGPIALSDPVTGRPADFSSRKPLLGFYDEMQQPVVDTQIKEAASEGIDFLAFYWYLDPSTGRELDISAPVRKFFQSGVRDRIKFVLAPIVGLGSAGRVPLNIWRTAIVPQILDYMASPSYYRVDGRPMLVDFRLPFSDPDDYAAAYAVLRRAAAHRLGKSPMIINLLGPQNSYRDLAYRRRKLHPDGFTCFTPVGTGPAESYSQVTRNWGSAMTRLIGLIDDRRDPSLTFIPCGTTGIDARPWYGIGWTGYNGRRGPDSRPYSTRPTTVEFRRHLEDLKAFMVGGRVNTLNTAILYAWNEWGEAAAAIEPSRTEGYKYVDVVRDVFGLTPRSNRP